LSTLPPHESHKKAFQKSSLVGIEAAQVLSMIL
jgi:hypothetical protein